jgi:hypothetical protein
MIGDCSSNFIGIRRCPSSANSNRDLSRTKKIGRPTRRPTGQFLAVAKCQAARGRQSLRDMQQRKAASTGQHFEHRDDRDDDHNRLRDLLGNQRNGRVRKLADKPLQNRDRADDDQQVDQRTHAGGAGAGVEATGVAAAGATGA